ncbi:hypothetical protein A7U60_g6246 [Sanghuangporus baumii]|uniref:Uncharacterized protein n=1 Tax=Sanghuangporus baumii TaxID=108892 RepID=A0A9Q5HVL7_SANBA|nr:hypothetical protein A7U60_g6246 [Sanghuangporus baumii]
MQVRLSISLDCFSLIKSNTFLISEIALAGATLTAVYESTIGRARAIRELEARRASSDTGIVSGRTKVGQLGNLGEHIDAAKTYRHNTALLTASAALNSGLVAFAFFSLRELVISPVLAGTRSSTSQTGGVDQPLTWSTMRMHHLEDSALTGVVLGGAFNAWKRAFTASLACTALQLLVNELDVQRVRYVSHSGRSSTSAYVLSASESQNATSADANRPSFGERVLTFIGITKVDDTEYLRRLKAKRDAHLARIRELEAQIEKERRNSDDRSEKDEHDSNGRPS